MSSRQDEQAKSRIERRRQRLLLLKLRASYWQEVEKLREKWNLPEGGFRMQESEDEDEYELRFLAYANWDSVMAEEYWQVPSMALWEDIERLNRKNSLPRSDDYLMFWYLVDGEVAASSMVRPGPRWGYDAETGEPFAYLPISPDLTLEDIKGSWEAVEEARSWLSDERGEPETSRRIRRNLPRDLFIWEAVRMGDQTYDAAYDQWLREHPYDEPVEISAIIHAVQAIDREIGE